MAKTLAVKPKFVPVLDPTFVPAELWVREYLKLAKQTPGSKKLLIALDRQDGTIFVEETMVLPHTGEFKALNVKHVERLVKFLLWMKGSCSIRISDQAIAAEIQKIYSAKGARAFDYEFFGEKAFLKTMTVGYCELATFPKAAERTVALGRHLEGCRIGFDLGGSDRKVALVIDGKQVYTNETKWDPYFQKDPQYHYDGILDSLKKAETEAKRRGLKIDAIGGSSAGVIVNSEVRVASLFRGITDKKVFATKVRGIFQAIAKKHFPGVPMEVANDGEVTALAGSMSMKDNAVFGISMGTSQAAGYVTPNGNITSWLNELAFVPVDYRENGPLDEWSLDGGCGVQYFSQQGVGRLAKAAGFKFPADMKLPEQLEKLQEIMKAGKSNPDYAKACQVYETIGTCFGYTVAWYCRYYQIKHMLVLGRVTSGAGGEIILAIAKKVLKAEFPEYKTLNLRLPSEADKRTGQAVAAASLPALAKKQPGTKPAKELVPNKTARSAVKSQKPAKESNIMPTKKTAKPAAKAKPAVKKVVKPAPAVKAAKPVAKKAVKPAAKPVAKKAVKPAAKPVAKKVVKAAAKPVAKKVVKPAAKPVAKKAVKPAAKPVVKAAAKPVAKKK